MQTCRGRRRCLSLQYTRPPQVFAHRLFRAAFSMYLARSIVHSNFNAQPQPSNMQTRRERRRSFFLQYTRPPRIFADHLGREISIYTNGADQTWGQLLRQDEVSAVAIMLLSGRHERRGCRCGEIVGCGGLLPPLLAAGR